MAAKKTLAEHLQQASLLFGAGEIVKAGQIWQAILKIQPSNEEAKVGLLKVRDVLSKATPDKPRPETSLMESEATEANGLDQAELLMKQGRAHYDQGSLHEALAAWEKVLEMDPDNNLALSYARGVRKELGLPIPEAMGATQDSPSKKQLGEPKSRAVSEIAARLQIAKSQNGASSSSASNKWQSEKIASQIEKGSQLYKMGKIVEAITAWESALSMDPDSALTKGYLAMACEDLDNKRQPSPVGVHQKKNEPLSVSATPEFERQDGAAGLADGTGTDVQSSLPAFAAGANNLGADAQDSQTGGRYGVTDPSSPLESDAPSKTKHPSGLVSPSREGVPAKMPAMIIESQATTRQGPVLPQKLHRMPFLSRLFTPRAIKAASLLIFLSVGAAAWAAWARRDALLRATQAAIMDEAIKTANQSINDVSFGQSTDELKSEARSAMSSDPLMAYLLVQEVISRDPNDTNPVKMLEQVRQAMAAAPKVQADGDLSRFLSDGVLDDAEVLLKSTLMQNPNNMRARENLARVCLMQAKHLIANGQWGKARARLLMGAALYPKDPSWQARIKFLENLQSFPREDHARWAEILG